MRSTKSDSGRTSYLLPSKKPSETIHPFRILDGILPKTCASPARKYAKATAFWCSLPPQTAIPLQPVRIPSDLDRTLARDGKLPSQLPKAPCATCLRAVLTLQASQDR